MIMNGKVEKMQQTLINQKKRKREDKTERRAGREEETEREER